MLGRSKPREADVMRRIEEQRLVAVKNREATNLYLFGLQGVLDQALKIVPRRS